MKKGRINFIAGMLVMALLSGLVGTAFAVSWRQETATLNYGNIKVTLNGETVPLVNETGGTVEPFAINGTTYLPIRAISSALGLDVEWDGETNTAVLSGGSKADADVAFYSHFSVPALDNIVGSDALIDEYLLETGDSIAYSYDPSKVINKNYLDEYASLLLDCGFTRAIPADGDALCYKNAVSGITVVVNTDLTDYITVLVMNLPDENSSGVDSETLRRVWDAYRIASDIYENSLWAVSELEFAGSTSSSVKEITDHFYECTEAYNEQDRDYNEIVGTAYSYLYDMLSPGEELMYSLAKYKASPSASEHSNFYDYFGQVQEAYFSLAHFYDDYIYSL